MQIQQNGWNPQRGDGVSHPKSFLGFLAHHIFTKRERGEKKGWGVVMQGIYNSFYSFAWQLCIWYEHAFNFSHANISTFSLDLDEVLFLLFLHVEYFRHPFIKYTHAPVCGAFPPSIDGICIQPVNIFLPVPSELHLNWLSKFVF